MRSIITRALKIIGAGGDRPPSERRVYPVHELPRVEPGSALDTIADLNPSTALTYADVVAGEIKQAISDCTISDSATTTLQVLEQIHGLKNAIAPTGSQVLLKRCEQLRLDASHSVSRALLVQDFQSVASAATLLLRNFRRSLSKEVAGVELSSDGDRDDPEGKSR